MFEVLTGWIIMLYFLGFSMMEDYIRMMYALMGQPPEHWPHFWSSLTWPFWAAVDVARDAQ